MSANEPASTPSTFSSLLTTLLLTPPPPLLSPAPAGPSCAAQLAPRIAALQLHPTVEAALHLLNADLPAAHFLVRHMQAAPALEGMLLHGILHRVEGDFANARAWYGDVWAGGDREGEGESESESEGRRLVGFVWARGRDGGEGEVVGRGDDAEEDGDDDAFGRAMRFVERMEGVKGAGGVERLDEREREELGRTSGREIERVLEWCVAKFGAERWVDASEAWVRPGEKIKEMGNAMTTGDEGFRKF